MVNVLKFGRLAIDLKFDFDFGSMNQKLTRTIRDAHKKLQNEKRREILERCQADERCRDSVEYIYQKEKNHIYQTLLTVSDYEDDRQAEASFKDFPRVPESDLDNIGEKQERAKKLGKLAAFIKEDRGLTAKEYTVKKPEWVKKDPSAEAAWDDSYNSNLHLKD